MESTTDSLHLAILFVPLTLRDAIIAAVDRLSDSDRAFRETAVGRMRAADIAALTATISAGSAACWRIAGRTRLLRARCSFARRE